MFQDSSVRWTNIVMDYNKWLKDKIDWHYNEHCYKKDCETLDTLEECREKLHQLINK